MAFMLGLMLATVGVVACFFVGLVLLAIPKWRQLASYALLVYPSAYVSGLVCWFVVGLSFGNISADTNLSPLLEWTLVLVIYGAGGLGAVAGALTGFYVANRLWWRFFSTAEQRTVRTNVLNWLAVTPFEQKCWEGLSHLVRSVWNSRAMNPQ
jgi:hypothetical protein